MSKDIVAFKPATFYAILAGNSSFSQSLNINFIPDSMVVKQISYCGPSTDQSGVFMIYCSLINDFIGSFTFISTSATIAGFSLTPHHKFTFISPPNIHSPIQFSVYQINSGIQSSAPTTFLNGELCISIDFIKPLR
jgi:hypothetical protein